jgi:arginase
MKITIIQVPYDSGQLGFRMGKGPDYFVQNGSVDKRLREKGKEVCTERVEASGTIATEIGTTFEVNRLLAERVRVAKENDSFPFVLAGNCNSSVGTLAGIGIADTGVVWFDAHGDFNTPETTVSGFLDGMALAMVTGRCWSSLAASVRGFTPIREENVILAGVRDLDVEEKRLLSLSKVSVLSSISEKKRDLHETLEPILKALSSRVQRIYLHIDMDVLDPEQATANHFATPGGFSVANLENAIRLIGDKFKVSAAAITAVDPSYDERSRTLQAGVRLMEALLSSPGYQSQTV